VVLGLVGEIPVYCPDDARHEEGASTVQALLRNRRTCRSGISRLIGWGGGSTPSGRNREEQSTGPEHRGGPSRSSGEVPVMGTERRGRIIRGDHLLVNRRAGGASE
jgi:hypothetical protein